MALFYKILRVILIILLFFLGVSAIPGGIALASNLYAPPVEALKGSLFPNFVLPGLALTIIVGGSGLLAAILLLRQSKYGLLAAASAGTIIMFFEFVEVLVIGITPGYSLALQLIYFGLGTLIEILAMGMWFIRLRVFKHVL